MALSLRIRVSVIASPAPLDYLDRAQQDYHCRERQSQRALVPVVVVQHHIRSITDRLTSPTIALWICGWVLPVPSDQNCSR